MLLMIPYNNFKSIKKRQYAYKVLYFEDKWLHQLYDIKYPCCLLALLSHLQEE